MVGDEEPDIDYEVTLIYPINPAMISENATSDELSLIAKHESRDYELLIDYILSERHHAGYSSMPKRLRNIIYGETESDTDVFSSLFFGGTLLTSFLRGEAHKEALEIEVEEELDSEKMDELASLMDSTASEERIVTNVSNMNDALERLKEALSGDDESEINAIKVELTNIRQELIELEYFSLSECK